MDGPERSTAEELRARNRALQDRVRQFEAGSGLARVFLDSTLRVRWFTPAAAELMGLAPADLGRPVADLTSVFVDDDLAERAARALGTQERDTSDVRTREDRWFQRDICPCRSEESGAEGVVATLFDITDRKRSEQRLEQSEQRFRAIFEQAGAGIAEIDPAGRFLDANDVFLRMFGYERGELRELTYRDLVHPQDLEPTDRELERVRAGQSDRSTLERRNLRKDGGEFWSRVVDSAVRDESGRLLHIISTVEDFARYKKREQELEALKETLEHRVEVRIRMLEILHRVTRAANEAETPEEAMAAALACVCELNHWDLGHVWRRDGDEVVSTGVWHAGESGDAARFEQVSRTQRIPAGRDVIGRVVENGLPVFVTEMREFSDDRRDELERIGIRSAIVFPVIVDDEVEAIVEFFARDATVGQAAFTEIMPDLGIQIGQVLRRKRLEREVAERTDRERLHLGQELHDSVGQEIAAVGLMAVNLARRLDRQGAGQAAKRAWRLAKSLEEVKSRVRSLTKGILPVEIRSDGLVDALEEMVRSMDEQTKEVDVVFACEETVTLEDNFTATHLYRIAQEAAWNAVSHAKARQVIVGLDMRDDVVELHVRDDGRGKFEPGQGSGSGLRIMRYRARLIGGRLEVAPVPGKGTTVTCRLPADRGEGGA